MNYSIGELSKATGVKIPTIRYYEKEGVMAPPVRTEGNQRRYGPKDLDRLSFIKHARDLGLNMVAIRQLLELSAQPHMPCERANVIAQDQLDAVRARIAKLKRLEAELDRITRSCSGGHLVSDCNVLKAFADHSRCQNEH